MRARTRVKLALARETVVELRSHALAAIHGAAAQLRSVDVTCRRTLVCPVQ